MKRELVDWDDGGKDTNSWQVCSLLYNQQDPINYFWQYKLQAFSYTECNWGLIYTVWKNQYKVYFLVQTIISYDQHDSVSIGIKMPVN